MNINKLLDYLEYGYYYSLCDEADKYGTNVYSSDKDLFEHGFIEGQLEVIEDFMKYFENRRKPKITNALNSLLNIMYDCYTKLDRMYTIGNYNYYTIGKINGMHYLSKKLISDITDLELVNFNKYGLDIDEYRRYEYLPED